MKDVDDTDNVYNIYDDNHDYVKDIGQIDL